MDDSNYIKHCLALEKARFEFLEAVKKDGSVSYEKKINDLHNYNIFRLGKYINKDFTKLYVKTLKGISDLFKDNKHILEDYRLPEINYEDGDSCFGYFDFSHHRQAFYYAGYGSYDIKYMYDDLEEIDSITELSSADHIFECFHDETEVEEEVNSYFHTLYNNREKFLNYIINKDKSKFTEDVDFKIIKHLDEYLETEKAKNIKKLFEISKKIQAIIHDYYKELFNIIIKTETIGFSVYW